jgi:hypothetical protein
MSIKESTVESHNSANYTDVKISCVDIINRLYVINDKAYLTIGYHCALYSWLSIYKWGIVYILFLCKNTQRHDSSYQFQKKRMWYTS